MKTYLEALDLQETVEEDYDVLPLSDDPTMNQIRIHKEKKTKKVKAKPCLFVGVSQTIFTRIMALKSAKAIWDYLEKEYVGDEMKYSYSSWRTGAALPCPPNCCYVFHGKCIPCC